MSAMTPAEVLDAAADYIDEHGWHQGNYAPGVNSAWRASTIGRHITDRNLPACALGALLTTQAGATPRLDAQEAVELVIYEEPRRWPHISYWNDAPDQTAANVTATMRKVAADLRAKDGAQ